MYDEDGSAADQKLEVDERGVIEASSMVNPEQVMAAATGGIGVGVGIGVGGPGTATGSGTGLTGYWQHATTATSYWPSLFDCWTTPPIASGSQTLSLPRDDD
ncbi:uncharacterized protein LOC126859292 [Cataglyphis hispanica]|uniref:uncharacterized protein LOC126859292 n=1 Tax=Cataglyphis hispanica TaxID=1086592 RepID=UPI0021801BC6|nr:uncharacterized protein LOC126859292 [Cataglyphis hispanica]